MPRCHDPATARAVLARDGSARATTRSWWEPESVEIAASRRRRSKACCWLGRTDARDETRPRLLPPCRLDQLSLAIMNTNEAPWANANPNGVWSWALWDLLMSE